MLSRLLHSVYPDFNVPAYRGGLLVRPETVLHGEIPLKDTREGFHPLSVYRCLPAACSHHLLLLHPDGEEGGPAHGGAHRQQLSGMNKVCSVFYSAKFLFLDLKLKDLTVSSRSELSAH